MTHTWILDVLADLTTYARKNNLPELAEQLDDTQHIAVAEIAAQNESQGAVELKRGSPGSASGYAGRAGSAL